MSNAIVDPSDPDYCPDCGGECSERWKGCACHHQPDWKTLGVEWDGNTLYIDVRCIKCGTPGCVGSHETLAHLICWEE